MWLSEDAQLFWVVCHEFKKLPSEMVKCGIPEFAYLAGGLEWWKTQEKEAIENARHRV